MVDLPVYRIKGTIHGVLLCTHFGISLQSCVRFFGTRVDGLRHNYQNGDNTRSDKSRPDGLSRPVWEAI